MRTLQSILLSEEKGEQAHRQAVAMGLKYKGFGYWVDPQTGKVTHKTENDQLVAVEPDVESDKWGGDAPEGGGMPGQGAPMGPPGSFGGFMGQQQGQAPPAPPQMGNVLPGQEQAPKDLGKWEPGPDGNNCVDDQPTPEAPEADSYVGKTNYMNWTAGPDGDNFSNMDVNKMYKGILGKQTTVAEELNEGILDGLENFAKTGENPDRKAQSIERRIAKTKSQLGKDKLAGEDLTQRLQQYVSDPQFDMSVKDDDQIGEGAFGSVYNGRKGSVIKKGRIGPDELKAMYMMRNNKNFPTLLNARFDGPFSDESSFENNQIGGNTRAPGQSKYFDKYEASDFDEKYPTAPGTFAMSKASGIPLEDAVYEYDDEKAMKVLRNLVAARGHLHQSGIAHNDMHPGNVFVDEDQNVSILDMGLAKADRLAALREGLGFGGNNVPREIFDGDFQFGASTEMFDNSEINEIFDGNREAVLEMMMDEWGIDDEEDDNEYDRKSMFLDNFMMGGIREDKEYIEEMLEQFPALGNGKFLKKLTERLYRGLGTELENRMSNAFDKRQQDSRVIQAANALRKRRGESPIEIRNKNVVPPKNLDFDD